jgi:hypothetical protein
MHCGLRPEIVDSFCRPSCLGSFEQRTYHNSEYRQLKINKNHINEVLYKAYKIKGERKIWVKN